MSAGIQIDRLVINAEGGAIAKAAFAVLRDIKQYKAWLDGLSSADLVSQYGFTTADADSLKSAFTDLGVVADVFDGTSSATQSDRRVFARRLIGTGTF